MNTKKTYIALSIVFVVSLSAALYLPVGTAQTLAEIPAIGALVFALFQISRDRIAHERSLQTLDVQNSFSIGAASHMANIAFDKHVGFCEEYTGEMFKCVYTLFKDGPRKTALEHAGNLYKIRQKWSVWLTLEVEKELEKFEAAIRKIGAQAQYLESCPGDPAAIKEMYSNFAEVMGKEMGFAEWKGVPITGELAVTAIIGKLRKVLGIDELTTLRAALVARAKENLGLHTDGSR